MATSCRLLKICAHQRNHFRGISSGTCISNQVLRILRDSNNLRFCRSIASSSSSKDVIANTADLALSQQSPDLYRERFIPLTRRTTLAYLLQDEDKLTKAEKAQFEHFSQSLDAVIATNFTATLQELKTLFDPINPDKETLIHRQWNRKDRLDNEFWLLQRLGLVMEKANFYELPDHEVYKRLSDHEADEGVQVNVNMSQYDVIRFWVLGKESLVPQQSFLRGLYKFITRQPPEGPSTYYKRVVAAVRLKKDDKLMLKAFKEVPMRDIEKLLPQGTIKMGKFDKYVLYTSLSLTGLGLFAKWITIMAKVTVNWTLGLAALTGVLGARGWLSYKSKQNSYLATLNKMLYYKNIANNRGLITLVVDRAQDESFKEVLLTYTFLNFMKNAAQTDWSDQKGSSATGVSMVALENAIEDWVMQQSGKKIEFDANEPVKILEKVGVLSRKSSVVGVETLTVLPLDAALKVLPQTPLSVLTRVDETDIMEGYDSTVYEEDESQYKKRDKKWRALGWLKK